MDAFPDYDVQFVLWSLRVVETEVALFGEWLKFQCLQLLTDILIVIYSLVAVPGIYVLTLVYVHAYRVQLMTLLCRLNLYRHGRTSGNILVTTSCAIMYLLASVHCGLNFWRLSDIIKAQLAIGDDESEWVHPYDIQDSSDYTYPLHSGPHCCKGEHRAQPC